MTRPFIVIDAEQRSEEWRAARVGRLTASRAADMLATIKSGESASRRNLRVQLAVETLTKQPAEDVFVSPAMQWGVDQEPAAFAAYESVTGELPTRVGFCAHVEHAAGVSPDGVLGDFDGLLELKCPMSATHFGYLQDGSIPTKYLPQLRHALWVTGAQYIDFLSFDPRFPLELQTFYRRLKREDADIPGYEAAALAFLAEVQRDVRTALELSRTATTTTTTGAA